MHIKAKLPLFSCMFFVGLLFVSILLYLINIRLVNSYIYLIIFIGFIISSSIIILKKILKKQIKGIKKSVLIMAIIICFFVLSFFIFSVYTVLYIMGGKPYKYFTSPNGKNTVIVFEAGFIDAEYTAYPLKGIFYFSQDNGYVTRHDKWGDDEVKIKWISENMAEVKVNYSEPFDNTMSNGGNIDDIIIVKFDR